jgi:CDP-glucose 4,6-dehydratase
MVNLNFKNLFQNIFDNKTVFITGHTGFQGSWLSLWMRALNAKVVGYSIDLPTQPSLFEILELNKDIVDIRGNINDLSHLHDSISTHKPDFVFHLAAQPLVRLSYEEPIETFTTNVVGTANILESVRTISNVKSCVVVTSDKCYENKNTGHPYVETDHLGGYDPYSASKGAAEIITSSYRRSFFSDNDTENANIASVRAGNVIGGGDWAQDRLIPDAIRALSKNESILIRNPHNTRPWQHVLESISGMIWLSARLFKEGSKFSTAWNFGPLPQNSITVKEVIEKVVRLWGSGNWNEQHSRNSEKKHEAELLELDSTKANTQLQWNPVYSLDDSISKTINWYKTYYDHKNNMKDFTLDQILNYVAKAKEMNIMWTHDF